MQRKFGRLIEFDEQSRAYQSRSLITVAKRRTMAWPCGIVLDQGAEGACTGFSVAHEAAAEPVIVPGITNEIAREVYHRARQLDDYPGEDYEGSSVLGAMKAAMERGWYGEYRWAFCELDLALAIGYLGPAVLGINWYEGMSEPDDVGLIKPTGASQGGHAIMCNAYDAETKIYRLHNSWGPAWGETGECFLTAADMAELLQEDGEACIPLTRSGDAQRN